MASALPADANSSVLNQMAPALPPVFTFWAPQLVLPLFSDNSQNDFAFNEFKLSINNALQATPNKTSSEKLIFLLSILHGWTLSLLQQCACTENGDPFSTAWELLEREFFRKEVLFNSSLDKIFDHPNLKTLDDIQNILPFIRFKEVKLRTLGIMFPGEGEEFLGNTLLFYLICSKLPHFFCFSCPEKRTDLFLLFRQFLAFGDELICRLWNNRNESPQISLPPLPPPVRAPKSA